MLSSMRSSSGKVLLSALIWCGSGLRSSGWPRGLPGLLPRRLRGRLRFVILGCERYRGSLRCRHTAKDAEREDQFEVEQVAHDYSCLTSGFGETPRAFVRAAF